MIAFPAAADSLRPSLGPHSTFAPLLYALAGLLLLALLLVLWLLLGRAPRRRRAYQRALHFLRQKDWQKALAAVRDLQSSGRLPARWQVRAANVEGQCHRLAGDGALQEGNYEKALEHFLAAARLLHEDENEARGQLVEEMLAEVRRLFAAGGSPNTSILHGLIARILLIQSPCAEALFWQGLCDVRDDHPDLASASLLAARETSSGKVLDPLLYLGALHLREGKIPEALRYLSEANRLDPECPFVTWQLGMAIVAGGGDSVAIRPLQRALGSHGLGRWVKHQARAWVEGMPNPQRSFVARLAAKYPYSCPLMGQNVPTMVRQGLMALAEAHAHMGNFQEAANVYQTILQESPPSPPVLRGLGLTLAKLGHYDQAFKHLRAVQEQEDPRNHLTAGYLALCGARARPLRPEDKVRNITWAIQLLRQFDIRSDREWAQVCSAVFAEARSAGIPVAVEDQVRLCDVLASVEAVDPAAAEAYASLASVSLESVRPEHAWHYCRAQAEQETRRRAERRKPPGCANGSEPNAASHRVEGMASTESAEMQGIVGRNDLDLFALAFRDEAAARAFYAQRGWDIDEVAFTYLERSASLQPGRFPEALGPNYSHQGEAFLLSRSRRLEEAGVMDEALAVSEVLIQLSPHSVRGHDRLAYLWHRRGDPHRAIALLSAWHRLVPGDHLPLVRLAVIQAQCGQVADSALAIDRAMQLTHGALRAAIAFLGARLALAADEMTGLPSVALSSGGEDSDPYVRAAHLLQECLKEQPDHAEALGCLAAVRSVLGDRQGLFRQAAVMRRTEIKDGHFHYLAGVCFLAAEDYPQVIECAALAGTHPAMTTEAAYLSGWARFKMGQSEAAGDDLTMVVNQSPPSSSAEHAWALLGGIHFAHGSYDDAIANWSAMDPHKRTAWHFDAPLRETVFLTGVLALQAGDVQQAAARLAQAAQLGKACRPLLNLARIKSAQQSLLAETETGGEGAPHQPPVKPYGETAVLLEQALDEENQDPDLAYLLALACKRQGNGLQMRKALGKIVQPDAAVFLQLGLLDLRENQPGQAEQDFARAWQMDPDYYPAGYNLLLTRLSLGQLEGAIGILPRLMEKTADEDDSRLFQNLHALLRSCQSTNGQGPYDPAVADMTSVDVYRLLDLLRRLGHLETVRRLVHILALALPGSEAVGQLRMETTLLQARQVLQHCNWLEAGRLLIPLIQNDTPIHRSSAARDEEGGILGPGPRLSSLQIRTAFLNLAGCCACLSQDFDSGIQYFKVALHQSGTDPWLHQNLALAYEMQAHLDRADPHWNRYLGLLDSRLPAPPGEHDYTERLACECLARLVGLYSDKEQWPAALGYVQRFLQVRPDDTDMLEKMFHFYSHLERTEEAQKTLRRIQRLRPSDPQFEIYDLELIKIGKLEDVDEFLESFDRILKKYPDHLRLEERITGTIANAVTFLTRQSQQLTDQVSKTVAQIRRLPNYEIDWDEVQDYAAKLRSRFQKLKRTANRCLALIANEGQRRRLRDLVQQIDRQMERCRSMEK